MISIKNLKKSYINPETGKPQTVLFIPSLEIHPGDKVALFGSSGIGKTTLLHLISGLLTPDSGSITINGTDITKLGESARDAFRAGNIGYVFQTFNLLDGYTALENVLLGMVFTGNGAQKEAARKALEAVGLSHRLNYAPDQLSVGQLQRVAIARAVVNNPGILLADEPTGNLDPKTTADILDILFAQSEKKILLVVTHEEDVLKRFEKTINLEDFIPEALQA